MSLKYLILSLLSKSFSFSISIFPKVYHSLRIQWLIQLLITINSLLQNIMKASDSSIISESPQQQINRWSQARTRPPQKYPWFRISGSGQLTTHCPLSLHTLHSFTIHHPPPRTRLLVAVGLDNTNNSHSIISDRPSFAASPSPECPVAFSCIPSQPSHFKDELIIHHTRDILSVEKQLNIKQSSVGSSRRDKSDKVVLYPDLVMD